jgi:hypothetical protein
MTTLLCGTPKPSATRLGRSSFHSTRLGRIEFTAYVHGAARLSLVIERRFHQEIILQSGHEHYSLYLSDPFLSLGGIDMTMRATAAATTTRTEHVCTWICIHDVHVHLRPK